MIIAGRRIGLAPLAQGTTDHSTGQPYHDLAAGLSCAVPAQPISWTPWLFQTSPGIKLSNAPP
ncbi:hypothetical protein I551_6096 [Mycobacterium ulcerans str. Harvey]|uniref:Uncharacterized protein n=1 Tax=Mycobacterium ulcerans str. Harvey TaxID=1299332 RepID=A0ABN0QRP6_MYCUL|nr:hypothetical protein I551_6096 [Mycobacterium ulcerans str. Harvey]